VHTLQTKDIVKSQQMEYKKLLKANLIVLDDIMLFPLEKNIAVAFFNFINHIYESTSIVITTNKKPTEWAKLLDDEVIATALLDRILYRCEIINLTGESFRLQNRKTFLDLSTKKRTRPSDNQFQDVTKSNGKEKERLYSAV
jgi:DNA replication protein DnaC